MPITNIVSHITGITNSALVTTGSATPAPYTSVSITGATDGTNIATASKNMAVIYNRQLFAEQYLIELAGLSFNPNNWGQQAQAIDVIAKIAATDTARGAVENATTAEVGAGALDGAVSISPLDLYAALDPAAAANALKTRLQSLASLSTYTLGAVGSLAFLRGATTTAPGFTQGTSYAGSGLYYTGGMVESATQLVGVGTWRCLGYTSFFDRGTLFQRIA